MARFLKTGPVAADGTVVVAFNRAYNSPCAFKPPAGLPTTLVIAPDGRVARTFVGPVSAKDLDGVITGK